MSRRRPGSRWRPHRGCSTAPRCAATCGTGCWPPPSNSPTPPTRTPRHWPGHPASKAGAAELAAAMAALGHRNFAVLSGPPVLTTVVDRVAGFREGLAAAGIELADDQIVEGAFTRDGGHAAATALLDRGLRATCILAATDIMAVGALTALRDRGLSVPGDVSLTGFDDIPFVRDLTPPLTTYALPLARLGERAMTLALQPAADPRTERVPGEVVLRASTNHPESPS